MRKKVSKQTKFNTSKFRRIPLLTHTDPLNNPNISRSKRRKLKSSLRKDKNMLTYEDEIENIKGENKIRRDRKHEKIDELLSGIKINELHNEMTDANMNVYKNEKYSVESIN